MVTLVNGHNDDVDISVASNEPVGVYAVINLFSLDLQSYVITFLA